MSKVHLVRPRGGHHSAKRPRADCPAAAGYDWYEFTKHELNHYLSQTGRERRFDRRRYGQWRGSRQAVDEFLRTPAVSSADVTD